MEWTQGVFLDFNLFAQCLDVLLRIAALVFTTTIVVKFLFTDPLSEDIYKIISKAIE